jgi:hypothetical protein
MTLCAPCQEAGAETAATRMIAVGTMTKRAVPMCTSHAAQSWKPTISALSSLSEPGVLNNDRYAQELARRAAQSAQRLCQCGCKQAIPASYPTNWRYICGHRRGRLQLGQEVL